MNYHQEDQGKENRNSQQPFEALFQYASIGIIVTNKNGQIIDMNKYAVQHFGYHREELIGQQIEILIPGEYRNKHHHQREIFYKDPKARVMGHGRDLFGLKKDGNSFPVEISLSHYELNGEFYAIAFVIDITVRKENEKIMVDQKLALLRQTEEIKHLNSELERKVEDRTKMLKETLRELEISKEELSESLELEKELGELKSRFVTMASHEFRTPLSTILSSASLVSKYTGAEDQDKREKHVNRIKDAVESMKSILEDFLSLGKLEEGSLSAKPERRTAAECVEVIGELVMDFQNIAKTGQEIRFTHACAGEVDIDMNLLRNVLVNLVSNAIKFSNVNGHVEIHVEADEQLIVLSVKDNGIGISEEDLGHLFERFFRAKNAMNIQGTGLGLHIVSRYVELMNGQIDVKSVLNEGTTVIVTIPRFIS